MPFLGSPKTLSVTSFPAHAREKPPPLVGKKVGLSSANNGVVVLCMAGQHVNMLQLAIDDTGGLVSGGGVIIMFSLRQHSVGAVPM